ncbi:MAG: c-type cytochrome [Anaerolineae bacterium]
MIRPTSPTPWWERVPDATPPVPSDLIGQEQLVRLGEQIYRDDCASCHQEDGRGLPGTYPALDENVRGASGEVAEAIEIMQSGCSEMPAFRDRLTAQEITATLLYIRNAWHNDADSLGGLDTPQDESSAQLP